MVRSPGALASVRYLAWALALAVGCGGVKRQLREADAYLEAGRYPAAVRSYQAVLQKVPGEPSALLGLARAWEATGEPERAIPHAREAMDAGVPGAAEVLVEALVGSGRGGEAVGLGREVLSKDPENVTMSVLLSEACLSAGDLTCARGAALHASETLQEPGSLSLAAWVLARAGDREQAVELADRAMVRANDDPLVLAEAAAVFRMCGKPEKAKEAATLGRAVFLDHPDSLAHEAARRAGGGDREGAVRRLSWARAMYPEEGRYARDLGMLWLAMGENSLGAAELLEAVTLSPFLLSDSTGGVRVETARDTSMTDADRQKAIVQMLEKIGEAKRRLGDLGGAASALQRSVEYQGGNDPEAWLRVAVAWDEAGNSQMHMRAVATAVDRDSRNATAQYQLAKDWAAAGDVNRAVGHARIAWDLSPGDREVALLLGGLYEKRDEKNAARQVYEDALAKNPGDSKLKQGLKRVGGGGL